jgi:hypothetical protein
VFDLTNEQRQAILEGQPVHIPAPDLGGEIVVLRADAYEAIRDQLEDKQEKPAWAKMARKAASRWSDENPF